MIDIPPVPRDCECVHKDSVGRLYQDFGNRVRRQRTQLGILQAEVATRMGLTRASISNLEAGRQHPQLHQVYELARILEVGVEDLLPRHFVDLDQSRHEDIKALMIAAALNDG